MKKKVEGRNYVILDDESRLPYKVNKAAADKSIDKIERSVKELADSLNEVESEKTQNLSVLLYRNLEFIDIVGEIQKLEYMFEELQKLKARLADVDDEIPKDEDLLTLSDYGFTSPYYSRKGESTWEKVVYDGDDKEVVEEIHWTSPTSRPVYRERTIIWKKDTQYSRSSDTITYKKLRMTKKLAKAIENTRSKNGSDDMAY